MPNLAAMILGPKEEEAGGDFDAVCSEILQAFENKDAKLLNKSLGAYFQMKEVEPHAEVEPEGE